jgi:hypothetical protein
MKVCKYFKVGKCQFKENDVCPWHPTYEHNCFDDAMIDDGKEKQKM